ncbi:MAG: two-component regulator propeller domain-containing protein [Bacteroidota bacterium]
MKYSLFIFLLAMSFTSTGQTPAYRHYSLEDGLPSTKVYCMLQDQKGFMWFGTGNGLAKYDGSRFEVYSIEDGLPDPEVLNLFEDSQERLWVSCFQKNPCYLKDGSFYTIDNNPEFKDLDFKAPKHYFYEDRLNQTWISSSKYVKYLYSDQGLRHLGNKYYSTPNVSEIGNLTFAYHANKIINITEFDDPDTLYFSTGNIYPVVPYVFRYANAFYISKGDTLTKLEYEHDQLHPNHFRLNKPYRSNSLRIFQKDIFWFNYFETMDGAYKIDLTSSYDNRTTEHFLDGRKVSDIFQDSENTIWFLTLNDGVYAMPDNVTTLFNKDNYPDLQSENFTAITNYSNNRIIAGTDAGEFYFLQGGALSPIIPKNPINPSRVRQILSLSDHNWLSILDNDMYAEINDEFDPRLNIYRLAKDYPNYITAPKYIFQENNKVWIGHVNGLHYIYDHEDQPKQIVRTRKYRITAVGSDGEGTIWIGGMDGLLSQKDSFQIRWGEKFKQLSGRITDIKIANHNHLWVATAENDLVKVHVEDGAVSSIEVMNDILPAPIKNTKSLFKSTDQTLWISTNTGIYGLSESLRVRHIDTNDGLPSNDVNAVTVVQDTLWAATSSGLAKVLLNREKSDGNFPTYISGVSYQLNNKKVASGLVYSEEDNIKIPPGATMLDIQLSRLHFASGDYTLFEYIEEEKLLPVQWLTWRNLSSNISKLFTEGGDTILINSGHRIFGANVLSGAFQTKVTAFAKDGTRSLHPAYKTFTILPFWYETIWFSLFVIGVAAYFTFLFVRQRTQAKRFQRTASKLQLQAIKAQVNPHFVGNSINAIQQFFYPPDPIAASQYIATFTSLLRQTMHLSEVPFISFDKELSFITDYLEMVKLRFGERFEYQINKEDEIREDTLFPAMILQPILENATIHGFAPEGKSRLNIRFELKGNKLISTITDNGVGIETSKKLKKKQNRKRVSKGIQLLQEKINVMNKMYGLDLKIEYMDLSSINKNISGTQATLSYTPDKIAN